MKRFRYLALLALPALFAVGLFGGSARASGGSGAGAGGSGGGGGHISSSVTFDDWGIPYNRVLPHGQVNFGYSADGTFKSMTVQLSSINVPDGTVIYVETQELWPTATGTAWNVSFYPITIQGSKGILSVSTTNGDTVMFLPPTAGQTTLYIVPTSTNNPLMGAQLGHLN